MTKGRDRAEYFREYNRRNPIMRLSLPEELWAQLDVVAAKWGLNRSEAIRRIIYEAYGVGNPDGSL